MPKRLVDGDALWKSKKIKLVPDKYRAEYAWLLPLAQENGCFEYEVEEVYSTVYHYNRPDVTPEICEDILNAFITAGMLRVYESEGKTYAMFVGIESRLPAPSQRRKTNLPPKPAGWVEPINLEDEDSDTPVQEVEAKIYVKSPEKYIENAIAQYFDDPRDLASKRVELRRLIKALGEEEVRAAFDIWINTQSNNSIQYPVAAFLKRAREIVRASGDGSRPTMAQVTSPALQKVELAIALASDSEVVFNSAQKPLLAPLIRDFGETEVIEAFREFWKKTDDFTRKFAAKNFVETGNILLLSQRAKQAIRDAQTAAQDKIIADIEAEGHAIQNQAAADIEEDERIKAAFLADDFEV